MLDSETARTALPKDKHHEVLRPLKPKATRLRDRGTIPCHYHLGQANPIVKHHHTGTNMESLTLPHFPSNGLLLGLFTQVSNASFLRQQLLEGNSAFEYAFLDASVLLSRSHILAAIFRSLTDAQANRLKSRNVHSEIVFDLSPNNNIAESFRRFGIQDSTRNLVAVKVLGDARVEEVEAHLRANVQGEVRELTDEALAEVRDEARIRKVYRVEQPKKGEIGVLSKEAEAFVLGSMALKGS